MGLTPARRLYLTPTPPPPLPGRLVLVPNPRAARRFRVPYRSLAAEASEGQRVLRGPERSLFLARLCGAEQAARYAPALGLLMRAGAAPEQVGEGPLGQIYAGYLEALHQAGYVDEAEAFHRAQPKPRPIQLLGYCFLGAGELAFLERLAGPGSEVWLPYGDHPLFELNLKAADFLQSRGFEVVHGPGPGEYRAWTQARLSASSHPNPEAEVRHALRQVKALLREGVPAEQIALVSREERAYMPIVWAVAREYGVPVALFQRVPLSETRLGRGLLLLLRAWQEGWSRPALARLRRSMGEFAERFIEDLPDRASSLVYLEKVLTWLENQALYLPDELRERAAWRAIKNLLRLMPEEEQAGPDFARALQTLLEAQTVPYWPGTGVGLHSPLALFGSSVGHLFFLGAAEGLWPRYVEDDPVLGFHLRRHLRETHGLPLELPAEAARRELLSAVALLMAARQTFHLSYPLQMGGEPLEPSSLLEVLELTAPQPEDNRAASPLEWRQKALLHPQAEGDPVLLRAQEAFRVEFHRLYRSLPSHEGQVDAPAGGPIHLEALPDLLECSFRFWVRGVLKPSLPPPAWKQALSQLLQAVRTHLEPKEAALELLSQLKLPTSQAELLRNYLEHPQFLPPSSYLLLVDEPFTASWGGVVLEGLLPQVQRRPEGLFLMLHQRDRTRAELLGEIYKEIAPEVLGEQVEVGHLPSFSPHNSTPGSNFAPSIATIQQGLETTLYAPDWSERACWGCFFKALCRQGPHFRRRLREP